MQQIHQFTQGILVDTQKKKLIEYVYLLLLETFSVRLLRQPAAPSAP